MHRVFQCVHGLNAWKLLFGNGYALLVTWIASAASNNVMHFILSYVVV